jgi:excisionase family DNA binding protein
MATEPITCTIDEAVRISGISRSRIYQLIDDGKLTTTKIGSRRLVFVSSLRALLEQGHPEPVMPTPARYAHKSARI